MPIDDHIKEMIEIHVGYAVKRMSDRSFACEDDFVEINAGIVSRCLEEVHNHDSNEETTQYIKDELSKAYRRIGMNVEEEFFSRTVEHPRL